MEEEAHEFFHTEDHFSVDDLLVDLSNDDDVENNVMADSHGTDTTTAVADSSNSSSFSTAGIPSFHGDVQDGTSFSGDLCVPSDEKMIWASRALPKEAFYDDSFTGETVISSLYLSPPSSPTHTAQLWKKHAVDWFQREKASSPDSGADERRCLHCAADKTVQWRTGPMGPKTLCNACGVRYISGRLVPKYRPVASPTFVLTKHSISHRKVMELRRQKEKTKSHHEFGRDTAMILDVSSDGGDYLIHHNVVSDFREVL